MKKLLKIIFVLLLLLVISVSAFVFLFDANKYKNELAELAQTYTGRPVTLDGNISLSLYPWIGVELENVTIGNQQQGQKSNETEFSRNDFASIDRFGINVKIIPLLFKRLEIEKLVIHRLAVDFEVNGSGRNNWSDIMGETGGARSGLDGLVIGGIEVIDSRLSWFEAVKGKRFNLTSVNIKTESFIEGKPLPLTLSADIESNQPAWKASTVVNTQLVFNPGSHIFNARDLELVVTAQLPVEKMEPVTFTLLTDSLINVKNKTARLKDAKLSFLEMVMRGSFEIENIFSVPVIEGPIKISQFDANSFSRSFLFDIPEMLNKQSLKDVSLNAKFKTDFNSIILEDLSAKIDKSKIMGFVRIIKLNENTPEIRYELKADSVAWNDYSFIGNQKTMLPLDFFRGVDLKGRFDVEELLIDGLSVNSLHIPVTLRNSVLMANPVSLSIKQAKVRAAIELNARALPVSRASIKINNLDSADSLNPLLVKIMGKKPVVIEGIVTASAKLKASGNSFQAHRDSLKGTVNVSMGNLVVNGVDFNYSSRKVVLDYATVNKFRASKSYLPAYDPAARYEFKRLNTTFKVSGNKFSTNDLSLTSDAVNLSGTGYIDFQNNLLNYRSVVDINVQDRIDIRDKLLDHPMEYDVKGDFENLTTRFDIEKYDLRAGRLLHIEAKARRIRAINNKGKNSW